MGVMGEALQVCGKSEWLASYCGKLLRHQQAIAALADCLTFWAVEEFETVPRKYIKKVPGEEASIFETLLEVPKPKMQQYRSPGASRSEFISVRQNKNESLKE